MISQPANSGQRPCTLIVTGASSGIGLELARLLADHGNQVIAVGRDEQRLAALARHSDRIVATPFDLADSAAIDAFVAGLLRRHAGIDALINNAAIQYPQRLDDAHYDAPHIRHEIAINLTAPVLLTRALLPHLLARSRAAIVNVNSGLGFVPKRTAAVYSATKAGLRLFSEGLRVQLKGSNVRVIDAILPLVDTPMTAGRGAGKLPAAEAAAAIADGLWSGPGQLYVGKARALPLLLRTAPGLAARIMQRN